MSVLPTLKPIVTKLLSEFHQIPENRKHLLRDLTTYVSERLSKGKQAHLNFICTHNSRRSHISQIWAQAAAAHFGLMNVQTFSGGTEATAFNPRAVKAMKHAGFDIHQKTEGDNPVYQVRFSTAGAALNVFSKKYNDPMNPATDFAAVMTCSHADENCPFIPGATKRIALTYDDPKAFDGTSLEEAKYTERVSEIGREILYAFSLVK
jgi:arsenate reductase (thioredoxin)